MKSEFPISKQASTSLSLTVTLSPEYSGTGVCD